MKKLILLLLISNLCFAQKQLNQWRFGKNCGLDFNSGNPIPVNGSAMSTVEGVSSIADVNGNLLFYTDGIRVWNKNNIQMPNGFGLLGDISSTQSGIIVQRPNSNRYYYIFTVAQQQRSFGINYSIVDINLNSGLGDVITKNVSMQRNSSEKICVVRHCNNVDFWVVTRDVGRSFRVWLVTSAGINMVPVVSNISTINVSSDTLNPVINSGKLGQLKANPQGNRLGCCYYDPINITASYVFNNSTGVVSNENILSTSSIRTRNYGCEFSPNGRYLYVCYNSGGFLDQYDLCNPTVNLSRIVIATNIGSLIGSLQLATNGKIYITKSEPIGTLSSLSVINNPDIGGIGCNLSLWSVPTNCSTSFGLPNNAQYYIKPYEVPFKYDINCQKVNFYLPWMDVLGCLGNINLLNLLWDFGDGNTSTLNDPTHNYNNVGTYKVNLYLTFNCYKDTISSILTINNINVNLKTN
jgi:hypothetical protein